MFDCVEMKHKAQERIRQELAGATREGELAYWRRIEEEFLARRDSKRVAAEKEPITERDTCNHYPR
jgi:hypothetical protein